ETLAIAGEVVRLAEQMGQGKADVESRIAEVEHFMVKQDQFALVHEDVFGAVVAVDETEAAGQCLCDQLPEEIARGGNLLRGVAIVGLDAERLEEGSILKQRVQVRPACGMQVDRANEAAELIEMVLEDVVAEEKGFEIVM